MLREVFAVQVILDKKKYDELWDMVYDVYGFCTDREDWLDLPSVNKKYRLAKLWTQTEESLVNAVLKRLCKNEMYALDLHHDCFVFSPDEEIPLDYWYEDRQRNCNVYFPSYYPDGDYHFFISRDLDFAIFGHPWLKEIYVMGEELINEFEKLKTELGITDHI